MVDRYKLYSQLLYKLETKKLTKKQKEELLHDLNLLRAGLLPIKYIWGHGNASNNN